MINPGLLSQAVNTPKPKPAPKPKPKADPVAARMAAYDRAKFGVETGGVRPFQVSEEAWRERTLLREQLSSKPVNPIVKTVQATQAQVEKGSREKAARESAPSPSLVQRKIAYTQPITANQGFEASNPQQSSLEKEMAVFDQKQFGKPTLGVRPEGISDNAWRARTVYRQKLGDRVGWDASGRNAEVANLNTAIEKGKIENMPVSERAGIAKEAAGNLPGIYDQERTAALISKILGETPNIGTLDDAGLALNAVNQVTQPISTAYTVASKDPRAMQELPGALQGALTIGDIATQFGVGALTGGAPSAATSMGKLGQLATRYLAMDAPGYAQMIRDSGGVDKALIQFGTLIKDSIDPTSKIPTSQRIQGLALGAALLLGGTGKLSEMRGNKGSKVEAPALDPARVADTYEPSPSVAKVEPGPETSAVDTSFRPTGRNSDPEQSFQKTIRIGTHGAEINSKAHPGVTTKVDLTPAENAWIAKTENLHPRAVHEAWATPEGQAIAKKINDAEAAADHAPASVGDFVSGHNGSAEVKGPVVEMFNGKYVVEDSISGKQKVLEADQITGLERKSKPAPSVEPAKAAKPAVDPGDISWLDDAPKPRKPKVEEVFKRSGDRDNTYFYTNNRDMGMTASGSFTKDKNRWIAFDHDEVDRMVTNGARPYGATQDGLFTHTESKAAFKSKPATVKPSKPAEPPKPASKPQVQNTPENYAPKPAEPAEVEAVKTPEDSPSAVVRESHSPDTKRWSPEVEAEYRTGKRKNGMTKKQREFLGQKLKSMWDGYDKSTFPQNKYGTYAEKQYGPISTEIAIPGDGTFKVGGPDQVASLYRAIIGKPIDESFVGTSAKGMSPDPQGRHPSANLITDPKQAAQLTVDRFGDPIKAYAATKRAMDNWEGELPKNAVQTLDAIREIILSKNKEYQALLKQGKQHQASAKYKYNNRFRKGTKAYAEEFAKGQADAELSRVAFQRAEAIKSKVLHEAIDSPKPTTTTPKRTAQTKAALDAAVDDLKQEFGKLHARWTPEQEAVKLQKAAVTAKRYIEHGYATVEEAVQHLSEQLGRALSAQEKRVFTKAWEMESKPVETPKVQPKAEGPATGLARQFTDPERLARELSTTKSPAHSINSLVNETQKDYNSTTANNVLSRSTSKDYRPTKEELVTDTAMVANLKREVMNEYDRLLRKENRTPQDMVDMNAVVAKLDQIDEYAQSIRTHWHDLGMALQVAYKPDFTVADLTMRARAMYGDELPASAQAKISEWVAKYESAQKELDALKQGGIPKEVTRLEVSKPKAARITALKTLQRLGIEVVGLEDITSGHRAKSKQAGMVDLPTPDPNVENGLRKAIRAIAKSYIVEEHPLAGSLDGVVTLVRKHMPTMSESDILRYLSDKYHRVLTESDVQMRESAAFMKQLQRAAEYRQLSVMEKGFAQAGELLNTTQRGLQASMDVSAPFRQGRRFMFTKEWVNAWLPSTRAMFSRDPKKGMAMHAAELARSPYYPDAVKHGLGITTPDGSMGKAEELWAGHLINNLAESKIPALSQVAKGIVHSEAHYTIFLNDLRMRLFENLAKKAPKDQEYLAGIAQLINVMTGRGHGKTANFMSNPAMGNTFFAPRYAWSELQSTAGVPLWKTKSPLARQQAVKAYGRNFMVTVAALSMAKLFGQVLNNGTEVETDPRSTNFLKIKLPNGKTIDVLTNSQQYLKLLVRMGYGQVSQKGSFTEPGGFGGDPLLRFIGNKLSPAARLFVGLLQGWKSPNADGDWVPLSPGMVLRDAATPMGARKTGDMIWQDKDYAALINLLGFDYDKQPPKDAETKKAPPIQGLPQGLRQITGQPLIGR